LTIDSNTISTGAGFDTSQTVKISFITFLVPFSSVLVNK